MKKYFFILFAFALITSCNSDDDGGSSGNQYSEDVDVLTLYLATQAEIDSVGALGYNSIGTLTIGSQNSDITSLEPLGSLKRVGYLLIQDVTDVASLEGLHNIEQLDYILIKNTGVTNLQGLRSLNKFNKDVNLDSYGASSVGMQIIENPNLQNLSGLENVTKLPILDIRQCSSLTSLTGLENCEEITDLEIQRCDVLTDLSSISGVTKLRNCFLRSLPSLTSLSGLNNLEEIDNLILDSLSINSLEAFSNVSKMKSLDCLGNDSLTSLEGLEQITSLDLLNVFSNNSLTSLEGLQNLESLRLLEISYNHSLSSISNLSGLNKVAGYFGPSPSHVYYSGGIIINNNDNLESLDGLQNIAIFEGSDIEVINNDSLVDLCAIVNIFQMRFDVDSTAGHAYIYGNQNPVQGDEGNYLNADNCSMD